MNLKYLADKNAKFISGNKLKKEIISELFSVKGKGECFGYDGLMNKKYRTSTVFTIEDTDFFILNEFYFDRSFSKAILRAEKDRKDFLIERIPAFKENQIHFNKRFKYIKTHVIY